MAWLTVMDKYAEIALFAEIGEIAGMTLKLSHSNQISMSKTKIC